MSFYRKHEKKFILGLITSSLFFYVLTMVFGAMAEVPEAHNSVLDEHSAPNPAYTVTIQSVNVSNSAKVSVPIVAKKPKPVASNQTPSGPSQDYLTAQSLIPGPSAKRPADRNGVPSLYPEMVPICACESSYEGTKYGAPRQFENGKVLLGYSSPEDVGMCQINTNIYTDTANKLGYDLYTEAGNIMFANWLFEQSGAGPWYKSMGCWNK